MCKATKEALSREQLANGNESWFLRSTKIHRAIPPKESTVQLNIARKKHPNKSSKKKSCWSILNASPELVSPENRPARIGNSRTREVGRQCSKY